MLSQPAVLIADDEEIYVTIVTKILERAGIKVLSACDGIEAVRLYERHRHEIDLVLLDIQMPRMNGVETFRCLKELPGDLRVVMVSGHVSASNKKQLDLLGPAGYIEKPFTTEALSVFIRPLLGEQSPLCDV
jgi:CheY-like chemotaxis protein